MTSNRPYLIRALYEWILDNQMTPYILVDASVAGVEVPEHHVKEGRILLNIKPKAVDALMLKNDAITFNARFGGRAYQVYIPPAAVLAIYAPENGQGMAFSNTTDGEEEAMAAASPKAEGSTSTPNGEGGGSKKPALRVVK